MKFNFQKNSSVKLAATSLDSNGFEAEEFLLKLSPTACHQHYSSQLAGV